MRTIQKTLTCCLIFALAVLTVFVLIILAENRASIRAIAENSSRATLNAAAASDNLAEASGNLREISAQLADPKSGLQAQVAAIGATVVRDANGQVTVALADAASVVKESLSTADRRIGDSLARVDTALAETKAPLEAATGLLNTYQALPDRLAYSNRWLWDCPHFSGCLQSQTLALTGSARATMGEVAIASKKFPELIATFQETNTQIAGIAGTANRTAADLHNLWFGHKTFWQQVKGSIGLVTGGVRAGAAAGVFEYEVVRPEQLRLIPSGAAKQ